VRFLMLRRPQQRVGQTNAAIYPDLLLIRPAKRQRMGQRAQGPFIDLSTIESHNPGNTTHFSG
jgi:hypothetical protein